MTIWIAVVGVHADERTLGVSHSSDGADQLIMRAKLLEEFYGYQDYEWRVDGPFMVDEIYDWKGEVL